MRFAGMALAGGNYANAAMKSGGNMDSILSKNTPSYDALSNQASAMQSQEKVSAMNAQANVANAGLNSYGQARSAAFGAKATIAGAKASADATRSNGMMDMFGGIGGGIMSAFKPKFEYGKTRIGAGNGLVDGIGTLGPNYGIRQ